MWKVSRKYLLGAAVAGVAALGVTQAQAQTSWSGPYFGLHGGYGWGDTVVQHDVGVVAPAIPLPTVDSFNTRGRVFGAHLGLNVHVGGTPLVLGGQFSLSDLSINGSKASCAPVLFGAVDTCTSQADWLLLAMGRAGWASGPIMFYGTAGLAVAGVTSNDVLNVAGISPNVFRASAVHNGWAYGAGVEYKRTLVPCSGHGLGCGSSVTFGLEYLHVDLDQATHTPSLLFPRHVDPDFNIVRASVSIALDTCCGQRPLK